MKIHIVNGPNLNLLGTRETEIYGSKTLDEVIGALREQFHQLNIHHFQSNHEGELIDYLQKVGFTSDGIILNAAGYTHTSIALRDTVKAISSIVVEVHISNIYEREDFRKFSYIKEVAVHQITGKGVAGYQMAIEFLLKK